MLRICWQPFSGSDWTQAYLNSSRWWQFILSALDTDVQNAMEGHRVGNRKKKHTQHNKHCSICAALIVHSCSFPSGSVLSLCLFVFYSHSAKTQKWLRPSTSCAFSLTFVFTWSQKRKSWNVRSYGIKWCFTRTWLVLVVCHLILLCRH